MIIFLVIICFSGCKKTDAKTLDTHTINESQTVDPIFQRNPVFLNFRYDFQKLNENEILLFRYDNISDAPYFLVDKEYGIIKSESGGEGVFLKLYAKNTETNEERTIEAWSSYWAGYQYAIDKKSGIFFLNDRSNANPLLKIDGKQGVITYLMNIRGSVLSSKDLKYLLCNIYGEETKVPVKSSAGSTSAQVFMEISKENNLALIDVEKIEVVKLLKWNITPLFACSNRILRCLDDNNDFCIYYNGEYTYAIAYYNIEADKLDTVFDVTKYGEDAWRYAKELRMDVSFAEIGMPDYDQNDNLAVRRKMVTE